MVLIIVVGRLFKFFSRLGIIRGGFKDRGEGVRWCFVFERVGFFLKGFVRGGSSRGVRVLIFRFGWVKGA